MRRRSPATLLHPDERLCEGVCALAESVEEWRALALASMARSLDDGESKLGGALVHVPLVRVEPVGHAAGTEPALL